MKKAASIILCLLFVFVFSAGGLSESTPRIWRVTDRRGNCIYLLGTVHVSVPDMFPVAGIEAVLDECDTLALEIYDDRSSADRDEEDRSLLEILWDLVCDLLEEVDPDGCGLEGEELRQASELVGIPSWILRFLSPELVNGLIQVTLMEQAGVTVDYGVEEYLTELANERQWRIIGLETEEFQDELLASQSRGSLIWEMRMILQYAGEYRESILYTLECWRTGTDEEEDGNETAGLMPEDPALAAEMEEFDRRLTEERNIAFLADAEGFLARGEHVLIAVGDAHISDPGGLADLLRQKGYTVERIHPEQRTAPDERPSEPDNGAPLN